MTRTQVTSGSQTAPAGPFPQAGHKSQMLLFVLLALGLAISGLPSPLYGAYQREWGFSSLTLTVIFAVYALAALAALLVVGRLSDSIGRKPVLLTSQVMLLAGLGLFVAARSAGWLIVTRALHGAAIGRLTGTRDRPAAERDRSSGAQRLGHLPDRGRDGRGPRPRLQQLAAAPCRRYPGRRARSGHVGLLPGGLSLARDSFGARGPGGHPVRPDPHVRGIRCRRRDRLRCRGMARQQTHGRAPGLMQGWHP